jgi:hypothetical protein
MEQHIIVMKQTENGTPLFEMMLPAVFCGGLNLKVVTCDAKLQCVACKEGWRIMLHARGMQIAIPLAELAALVETTKDVLKGFGK